MRKPYQPQTPPFALRLVAVALVFATFGLLVVLPAEMSMATTAAPDHTRQAAVSARSLR